MKLTIYMIAMVVTTAPAYAQLGGLMKKAEQAQQRKQQFDDLNITEAEEIELGQDVSAKVRERFGVVQDPAVHKYVTLVGTSLTDQTTRPKLPWTFIVLDTDGVNAFAAPGGFVHITRGALGLIKSEAELQACSDTRSPRHTEAHRQRHPEEQRRAAWHQRDTLEPRCVSRRHGQSRYGMVLENAFDRGDELDADKEGILIVQKAGYAGTGLSEFLATLAERNKGQAEKNGLFASHPETQERIAKVKQLAGSKPGATVAARYTTNIKYQPTDATKIATVVEGSAGLAGGEKPKPEEKKAEEKKRGFGLGSLTKSVTGEKQSQQVAASAGARGVGADRMAKGGDNPNLVKVAVTPAEVAAFKKGIV